MKTTVDIADDLLKRARAIAHQNNITLKTLTEEGLRLAIEKRESQAPIEIDPHVVTGKDPSPDLSWRRLRDVLYGNEGASLRE